MGALLLLLKSDLLGSSCLLFRHLGRTFFLSFGEFEGAFLGLAAPALFFLERQHTRTAGRRSEAAAVGQPATSAPNRIGPQRFASQAWPSLRRTQA